MLGKFGWGKEKDLLRMVVKPGIFRRTEVRMTHLRSRGLKKKKREK